MGSAESKGASNTDCSERVQTVGVGKSLIFGGWFLRIASTTWFPMMMFDAIDHCPDFLLGKTTFGQRTRSQRGTPHRVIGTSRAVADVMQQRGGFNYVAIRANYCRNANRDIADPKCMVRVMS